MRERGKDTLCGMRVGGDRERVGIGCLNSLEPNCPCYVAAADAV